VLGEVDYLLWIREAFGGTRLSLASSGMPPPAARLAGLDRLDVGAHLAKWPEGSRRLEAAVAARLGAPPACVVAAPGTTGANFLAFAATVSPGDEVLLETPRYGPLEATATGLGARVVHFGRPASRRHQPDPDEVAAQLGPRTRLVVLTDPHNPSGVRLDPDRLEAIVDAVAAHGGALVLVDEVYREAAPTPFPSCADPAKPIIATASLTKAYGLPALRAGWAAAPEPVAARLRAAADHVVPGSVEPGWSIAAGVLEGPLADAILADTRAHLRRAGARLDAFLAARPDFHAVPPDVPCVAFVEVPARLGSASELTDALLRETGVLVVPGRFFGDDSRVRIALCAPPDQVEAGLEALTSWRRP